ncbi:hypothetical protein BCV39_20250 [Vibrio sp. 10N.286.55.E10]|uniref:hypothetical protein n=1 Tax=unclassified Vibrio TaxID=2614977 RepID=UPI000C8295AF|nr:MULTISPECIES: hypothetical protein [unclassified Vibrio]PME34753.1 hypothetical protein BCV39_20250 [Vibrio sp. 10N.286.55.E10]PME43579.1 hypothetical protein BCV40_20195 [Vibrio sp. 10N.286.55.E12]PME67143.1 hypothetical protein BCV32_15415 [Vibrio sp. 10N.286.55.C11]PTP17261.1 hypothetical protein CWO27_01685 [Vibrio sp. 10N.286.51.C3]TKE60906.1 hypothetical protein FCV45_21935 [Vibrio sp. F12]
MKKLALIALFSTSLFGCVSEQYFVGQGAEALVYKEHHSFEFVIKKRDKTAQQISDLIQEIESVDKEATYVVDYKSAANKQLLQSIFKQYPSHIITPQRVVYRYAQSLPSDLGIKVTLTRLKTQTCKPAQIHVNLRQSDCFVESMRLKQVAHKSRLVGEQ